MEKRTFPTTTNRSENIKKSIFATPPKRERQKKHPAKKTSKRIEKNLANYKKNAVPQKYAVCDTHFSLENTRKNHRRHFSNTSREIRVVLSTYKKHQKKRQFWATIKIAKKKGPRHAPQQRAKKIQKTSNETSRQPKNRESIEPNGTRHKKNEKKHLSKNSRKGRTFSPKDEFMCRISHVNPSHAHDVHL